MRFQRQIQLSEVGREGQEVLRASRVLVIGAGGLGHPVIQYLSSMGVGTMGVVDGDIVSENNLHRQVIFESRDIGRNKAEVIREKFQLRREPTDFVSYSRYLDKRLALEIFPQYDLVVDSSDNFETKFLINDICCLLRKPMIYGAISQFEGQVSVFWNAHGPCYRCFIREKPITKIKTCVDSGVVGVLPGIIGCVQAMEAFKTLQYLKRGENRLKILLGSVQIFDFANNSNLILRLGIRSDCLCQNSKIQESAIADVEIRHCSIPRAAQLIDVREAEELGEFVVAEALHWPLSRLLKEEFPDQPLGEHRVAICGSGDRAEEASEIFRAHGFENVTFTQESIYGYQTRSVSSNQVK